MSSLRVAIYARVSSEQQTEDEGVGCRAATASARRSKPRLAGGSILQSEAARPRQVSKRSCPQAHSSLGKVSADLYIESCNQVGKILVIVNGDDGHRPTLNSGKLL
jgi:hypothetical protein